MIAEGLALVEKAMRHRRPGPYQVQAAIAALHVQAPDAAATDWAGIERLYAALERMQPSPVVTLNRAVAVSKVSGPEAALAMIEPLESALGSYFYLHGCGARSSATSAATPKPASAKVQKSRLV